MPDSDPLNLLEPLSLVDCFMAQPPIGFQSIALHVAQARVTAFIARFDLLTTLDAGVRRTLEKIPLFGRAARTFLRPRALFAGSTVSEYALYPALDDYTSLTQTLKDEARSRGAALVIVKDVPKDSPLLSARENEMASRLLKDCRANGFEILSGQALAYVPIDFPSTDEYLQRLSAARRKDLRRKLRQRSAVQVDEVATGDSAFADERFVGELYAMYAGVFAQSEIHFDQLSPSFFRDVFRDAGNGGVVFLYRAEGKLVGFNLCFVCGGNLVDKYIGFVYPRARELNLYFLSWFWNLEYAVRHELKNYVVGWTDAEVKRSLGAKFTFTQHAVHLRNPFLRFILRRFRRFFEQDQDIA